MDITYIGHSCFKLRTSSSIVIMDPYDKSIGFDLPRLSADIVTVSHQHADHNNSKAISASSRRDKPFIIDAPGEYEIGGVSVFGIHTYHDEEQGAQRGNNTVFSVLIDDVSVVHLGDLGHSLKQSQLSELNGVDVLLCPVGGHYTLDPKKMIDLISQIEPSIIIPMHYKTEAHDRSTFEPLISLDQFIKDFGSEAKPMDKLTISPSSLPEEMELVVLSPSAV